MFYFLRRYSSTGACRDMDDIENYRHGSYKPQYDVAKLQHKDANGHPKVITIAPEDADPSAEESLQDVKTSRDTEQAAEAAAE